MRYTDLKEPGYYTRVWADGDCYVFYFSGKSAKDFVESNSERVLTIRNGKTTDLLPKFLQPSALADVTDSDTLRNATVREVLHFQQCKAAGTYVDYTPPYIDPEKLNINHFNFMP